jgi:hypothetical protein
MEEAEEMEGRRKAPSWWGWRAKRTGATPLVISYVKYTVKIESLCFYIQNCIILS